MPPTSLSARAVVGGSGGVSPARARPRACGRSRWASAAGRWPPSQPDCDRQGDRHGRPPAGAARPRPHGPGWGVRDSPSQSASLAGAAHPPASSGSHDDRGADHRRAALLVDVQPEQLWVLEYDQRHPGEPEGVGGRARARSFTGNALDKTGLDGSGRCCNRRHTHGRYRRRPRRVAVPRNSADSARTRVDAPLDTAARHGIPRNPTVMSSHGTAPQPRSGNWARR